MKHQIASLLISMSLGATTLAQVAVDDLVIPNMPDWTDTYGDLKAKDGIFFNIDKIMKTYRLTRLQAIEVQRTYKDLVTNAKDDKSKQSLFDQALAMVQADQLTRVNRDEIEKAKFVIVFDLDETLYDQGLKADNQCADVSYMYAGKPKKIKTVKNIQGIMRKIKSLGGSVAIFSANSQNLTVQNLKEWKNEDGRDVYSMPELSAILTNKELIYQAKDAGYTVTTSSKDLRFFDEKLQKVIIIDDNPTRIFQQKNIRVVKKLDGDKFCETPELQSMYDGIITEVMAEIEDSANYMSSHSGKTFVDAFLPYSMMGKLAVDLLMSTQGLSKEKAIEKVRQNPDLVESRF